MVIRKNSFHATLLTEDEQVVNAGVPAYTRALEGSLSKTFVIDPNKVRKNYLIKSGVTIENWKYPELHLYAVNLVSTKFNHDIHSKESGVRSSMEILQYQGNFCILKFPVITPTSKCCILLVTPLRLVPT